MMYSSRLKISTTVTLRRQRLIHISSRAYRDSVTRSSTVQYRGPGLLVYQRIGYNLTTLTHSIRLYLYRLHLLNQRDFTILPNPGKPFLLPITQPQTLSWIEDQNQATIQLPGQDTMIPATLAIPLPILNKDSSIPLTLASRVTILEVDTLRTDLSSRMDTTQLLSILPPITESLAMIILTGIILHSPENLNNQGTLQSRAIPHNSLIEEIQPIDNSLSLTTLLNTTQAMIQRPAGPHPEKMGTLATLIMSIQPLNTVEILVVLEISAIHMNSHLEGLFLIQDLLTVYLAQDQHLNSLTLGTEGWIHVTPDKNNSLEANLAALTLYLT